MYFKSWQEFKNYIEKSSVGETEEWMIFAADQSADYVKEMMDYLNSKGIKFFGGIYPALLVGRKKESLGFLVQKLEPVYTTLVFPYLMRCKLDLEALGDAAALVLVDGLSSKMKDLTDTVYNKLGNKVKYVGGGAGYYDLVHRPCIFNNTGLYQDALIVSIIPADMQIAVKHGWNRLAGPFYITKAEDNVLSELDSENAFEVYKHIVEEFGNVTLSILDFFSFAKEHPFGIVHQGSADIVRDPIMLNGNNEIVCVANVPLHKDVYVLKGDIDTLLEASIEVSEECAKNPFEEYIPLLFNCISRAMFMEERFEEELTNIQFRMSHPVIGALSIGEIASLSDGQLEIHNKSTILGALKVK